MMSLRCRSCNTAFHDDASLEVHYQYAHSNGGGAANSNNGGGSAAGDPLGDHSSSSSSQHRGSSVESDVNTSASVVESNNNNSFFKFHHQLSETSSTPVANDVTPSSLMTAISPDTQQHRNFHLTPSVAPSLVAPQPHHPTRDIMYDMTPAPPHPPPHPSAPPPPHHQYDSFMMAQQEYTRSSPVIGGGQNYFDPTTASDHHQRYHPYYHKQGFREMPRPMPVQSQSLQQLQRCDKCDFQCSHPELMLQHYHMMHNSMPSLGVPSPFGTPFRNGVPLNGGTEPQTTILDLDSGQKVPVYRPPNGEESQDSDHRSIDPWAHDEKKYFHHHQQQQQQQQQLHLTQNGPATNGRGGHTPLPSPDFGNVSTTTDNIDSLQSSTRSPYYESNSGGGGGSTGGVNSTPPAQISSSDNPSGRSSSKSSGNKNSNGSWKSNEARRPKTYNCSACNKWFTSSGHLKRHYNTTLHKNAVKQSGAPDPATLPVSVHHHPQKDSSYASSGRAQAAKNSPPDSPPPLKVESNNYSQRNSIGTTQSQQQPQQQQQTSSGNNPFLHHSPNLMAGPSEAPRGLLHPSYTQSPPEDLIKSPSPITALPPPPQHPQHSNHSNYLAFGAAASPNHQPLPFFQQHTPATLYPNFQSPHVSTTRPVTTNSPIGNSVTDTLNDCSDSKLPSFSCIQKNAIVVNNNTSVINNNSSSLWHAASSFDQYFNAYDTAESNVGGPLITTKELLEEQTVELFKNFDAQTFVKTESSLPVILIKCEPSDPESTDDGDPLSATDCTIPSSSQQPLDDTNVSSSTENELPISSTATTTSGVLGLQNGNNATYSCEKCNKYFNKTCYLTQHNKSFHSGDKPYKCVRCGKRFQDSQQYNSHLAKHGGDKPYKCEICPKQFNHKTDLRRHACLHTNVRPYNCDICKKGFIRKDHMLKHRETHQNRKSSQRRVRVNKIKNKLSAVAISCGE